MRVGIIGTGFGCSVQVPGFQACPGVEVAALCSRTEERAREYGGRLGIPSVYTDFHAMLEMAELDLISIVTPPDLHYPMTLAAMSAGKHVLCEKPMALDSREALEMYRQAEAKGIIHQINHQQRFDPNRTEIKRIIESGEIGSIYHATINITTPHRADPVAVPWSWWSQAKRGGGSLGATASHQLDLLRWWFGELDAVSCQVRTFVGRRSDGKGESMKAVDSEDQCSIAADFSGGQLGLINITSVARTNLGIRIEVHGQTGSVVLDGRERLWLYRGASDEAEDITQHNPNTALPTIPATLSATAFVSLARHLTRAIGRNKMPELGATFLDGYRCQVALDAARASALERRWVRLADAEQPTGAGAQRA